MTQLKTVGAVLTWHRASQTISEAPQAKKILQDHGIQNVAAAGFLSNVCVEATARSAYDRGYSVCVIKDATAATSHPGECPTATQRSCCRKRHEGALCPG